MWRPSTNFGVLRFGSLTAFWPAGEGNLEGNGGTYLEKGNIWSVEVKKNAEGKGGKYLEKENIWSTEEKRTD